jgi:hypothetical protein
MLREGIQECEARIFIERALVGEKVSGPIADSVRAALEEMIKFRYQNDKFKGGHAGGNLGKPDRMWLFPKYPQWQTLSAKLFTQAHEVAKAMGKE